MPAIPVILLSGFLGSGKTTLLNEILRPPDFEETALIINEFGDIALDQDLVLRDEEGLVFSSSGCICCEARSELVENLREIICRMLTDELPTPRRIVIETTGLADPVPVVAELLRIGQAPLFHSDRLGPISFSLQTVITLVSAVTGEIDIDHHLEAFKQVTMADTIVVTKTDLVADPASRRDLARLKQRLGEINPACRLHDKHDGHFKPALLLERQSYDRGQIGEDANAWLQVEMLGLSAHDGHFHEAGRHSGGVRAYSFEFDEMVKPEALRAFLPRIRYELGGRLLRMKGIIGVTDDEARPAAIHAVRWHQSSISQLGRRTCGARGSSSSDRT
jgi:G3E family GTPase